MMFLESSLFESSRCVFSPSSNEHWTLTTGCINLFGPVGGVALGGLVSTLLNVVEAGTHAIQEIYGFQTAQRVCNLKEMWVLDHSYGYIARLERHDGPDKATSVLLLPTKKAK
ncbi:hypothetical protein NC651_001941 [Populus alba x Populus x berolinensis]|nr:hypothetical protein NC651_001941 [Populus alba x Populus x berolinensis]